MTRHLLGAICSIMLLSGGALATAIDDGLALDVRYRFRHLTIEDGLSQSSVHCLLQDRDGFIWLGTQDGLNRYDGREFRIWKTDADASVTFADPYLTALVETPEGNLWVGSESSGFGHFDTSRWVYDDLHAGPATEVDGEASAYEVKDLLLGDDGVLWVATASHGLLRHMPGSNLVESWTRSRGLPSDDVRALLPGPGGSVLVATSAGLVRYDGTAGTCTTVPPVSGDTALGVNALHRSPGGLVWIGTDRGLAHLTADGAAFVHALTHDCAGGLLLRDGGVKAIAEDDQGYLWLAGRGVVRFDPRDATCLELTVDLHDDESLQTGRIQTLMVDAAGVVWAGHDLGASLLDTRAKRFFHLEQQVGRQNTLSHNTVWSIQEAADGRVWIATEVGLNIWDPQTGVFDVRHGDPGRDDRPSSDRNVMVRQDSRGFVWLGNSQGSLDRYDPATGIFEHIALDSTGSRGAPSLRLYDQAEGPDGRLWQATYHGIQCYDPRTDRFTGYFLGDDSALATGGVACKAVEMGTAGDLWVGTSGRGLWQIDPDANTRTIYRHATNDPNSLCSDVVLSLLRDSRGLVWVGSGAGLARLDPVTGEILRLTEKDGLPNNTIYGIAEDGQGLIWISGNLGLIRLDPVTLAMDHYQVRDGCQSNEFNMGAAHFGSSGRMYFGGINGLNVFDPAAITRNPYQPPVLLTEFRINNERVTVGKQHRGRDLLDRPIEATGSLGLDYRDHVLSFTFAALHYAAPEKIRYQYMLHGFDSDWIDGGNRNHATYTNLPAGDYEFRVRATNSDGVWNDQPASLAIVMSPPIWRTAWFMALAGVLAVAGINGFIRYRTRLMKVRTAELERRVNRRTADLTRANHFLQQEITERRRVEEALRLAKNEAEEATRAKSDFLANMSHEIRTPMNGVLGMTSVLLSGDLTAEQREHLEVVYGSAHNLLGVINDILDFSKIEAGKLKLECIDFEPRVIVEEVAELIASRAQDKGLRFAVRVDHDVPRVVSGDPVRLRQILVNLVNNAVKFTECGTVLLNMTLDPDHGDQGLRVEVVDTGVGIPADRLHCLWESFSQVDASTTRRFGGTGLGLTICKQLVELMNGEIGVQSELGTGSRFWARIPFPASHASGDAPPALAGVVLLALAYPELNEAAAETLRFLGLDPLICDPGDGLPARAASALAGRSDCVAVLAGPTSQQPSASDVARELRAILGPSAPPCLLAVRLGELADPVSLSNRGFAGAISMPMRTAKLYSTLAGVLSSSAPAGHPDNPVVTDAAVELVARAGALPLLLAEDNPVNQKVASILLRRMGYTVEVVDNGAEAVAALARRRYRLVLMDVQMPVMDGYEAVRRIRLGADGVLEPGVPIVALTAHAMAGDRQRCLDAGMDDYLAKPIDAAALADLLAHLLEGREAAPV